MGINYLALGTQLKEMSDRAQSSIDIDLDDDNTDPEPELQEIWEMNCQFKPNALLKINIYQSYREHE